MDNAATTFPKPPVVHEAMMRYATELGASPGRGAYAEAQEAGHLMVECRERINELINGESHDHVIFTLNTSDALNLAIRGIVDPILSRGRGETPHVITTHLDHNSVLRPFNKLVSDLGVEQSRVQCDLQTGLVDPDDIRKAIKPNTCLIAVVHGSNVSGTLQPVSAIGPIAREHDIPFLVDAAQTLGHMPVDVQRDMIDLLAFPGHKGLLGPLGTGGLYIRPGIERRMWTVREGGTGSISEQDTQPQFMPDRFEPGSHNAIGIIGLGAAVKWILEKGVDQLWSHERELIEIMTERLTNMPGLTLFGPQGTENRCGVFAIRIEGFEQPQSLSNLLERDYNILTRSGIHCAPLAHETFGTHRLGGMTRFSFGPFTTKEDVEYTCDALEKICRLSPLPLGEG